MIESYHAKLNFYPPDNGGLTNGNLTPADYDRYTASNQLFYELTGVSNNSSGSGFYAYNLNNSNTAPFVHASDFTNVFYRGGVANSDSSEPQNFYQPGPTPQECGIYLSNAADVIYGLIVPAQMVANNTNNFIHYDASSTNRHNMNSYDIWAEYMIGSKYYTNGNW
jgi:hypothetical protein